MKTFCPYPWSHLYVDNNGEFKTCCVSRESSSPRNGEAIKAGQKDAIIRHWNSRFMEDMRKGMQNDVRHPACIQCWIIEDLGDKSFRHMSAAELKVPNGIASQTLPPPSFELIDLRFGNICNLACRMCIPYTSLKLINEWAEYVSEEFVQPFRKMDWFESDFFWDELFQYTDATKRIHLAGGEPLLIKQCWKFLRRLVESGKSKDIIISYNTNLTIIPDEARELWPKFKGVYAIISMDGVGKVNDFIRHPSKWNEFEKNLFELDAKPKEYNLLISQIHVTSQIYNIMRTDEICDYVSQFKFISNIPRFDILYGPEHFNIQVLPEAYRKEAIAKIEAYIEKLERGHNGLFPVKRNELIANIRSLATHMQTGDKHHLFHDFKRHTDIYDRNRDQKLFDYIPELEKAY